MICLMLVGLNLGVLGVVFGAEKKVTLTTYYPAPYGEYKEIKVSDELEVGNPLTGLIDPTGELSWDGTIRIYGLSPQLDFVDDDETDWTIHVNSDKMHFIHSPWQYQVLVLDGTTGYVGIGTHTPSQKLNVIGNILASGSVTATSFLYSSDALLKKDIQPLPDPLGKIGRINGVEFNWKADDKPDIGLIAQDVEKVLPGLVHTDQDGYKSIDYVRMIPVLVEAVKAQQAQIDLLEAQLKEIGKA